jgi:hypothetical protein
MLVVATRVAPDSTAVEVYSVGGESRIVRGQNAGVAPLRQRRSSLRPPRLESPLLAVGSISRRSVCTALGAKVL